MGSGRECKYTPLPTPAHRGIPRCDRCRIKNLKCDRNLPRSSCGSLCRQAASFLISSDASPGYNGAPGAPESSVSAGPSGGHIYERIMDPDAEGTLQKPGAEGQNTSGYNRPFLLDQGMIVTTPHVDPWMHQAFVPLPDVVVQTLRLVNSIEMPTRHAFEEALSRFLGGLSNELRDTATFPIEVYTNVANAISEGHISDLPPRLHLWASCHHARSGSQKRHLILLPRDAFYNMNREDEEKLRIYDVLVYTHRNHGSSSTMLFEARRIGIATITWPMVEMFIRLCPLCKMRSKGPPRIAPEEEGSTPSSFRPPPPVIKR
ncbi:hypothetical protein A0H81_11911 [Grifola frondosa]|uniref:Zn(2)-C6 fungal-type domain-containing protein n=1 Tax=Grifola frondosa TaxID=5627 RepID=A0A1C7LVD7_GRIFR|nr:hypothetical protein A0H81_11911 [Grifola frondosa]